MRDNQSKLERGYRRIHLYMSTGVKVGDGSFLPQLRGPVTVSLPIGSRWHSIAWLAQDAMPVAVVSLDHIRNTLPPPLIDGRASGASTERREWLS
jgi:hypothetical protein